MTSDNPSMLWHEQSWPQIQKLDKDLPVMIPLGSMEQHGPHLPLFVDSIQVTAIAERVEKAMPTEVLLLPTLWLGCSHHHMDFPGTVSVLPTLYSEMIKSVARCMLRHGFKRVFFLNGHGGNEAPGTHALTELIAENDEADAAWLVFSSWWRIARDALKPEQHGLKTPGITHACEHETSMILHLRPELVEQSKAVNNVSPTQGNDWTSSGRVSAFHRFYRLTETGNMGQPTEATAKKGQSMMDGIVDEVCLFLRDFSKWEMLPALK